MSTASLYLTVAGISVDVVRKDIKNLHIGVYPPGGRVRVAAPAALGDEQIRLAVIQRLPWIKRQRKQLREATRQSEREMVSGETHHVWGLGHRLVVIERPGKREIEVRSGRHLALLVPEGTDVETRRRVLKTGTAHSCAPVSLTSSAAGSRGSVSPWRIGRSSG